MKAEFLIEKLKPYGVVAQIITENVPVAEVGFCWSEKQSIEFDFTEHDKKVTAEKDAKIAELDRMRISWIETAQAWSEENAELKTRNEKLEKENKELREELNILRGRCIEEAVEYFDKRQFGSLMVSIPRPTREAELIAELEDRHQSDCIRINQLLTTIDILTERYQKLREVHGL